MDSVIIVAITIATVTLVLIAIDLPWGAMDKSPIQPPNKFRLVH